MQVILSSLSPELQKRIKAEAFKIDKRAERALPEERKLSIQYPLRVEEVKDQLEKLTKILDKRFFDEELSVNYPKLRLLEAIQSHLAEALKITR